MAEQVASASEVRDKFSEYLEAVQTGRVLVHKHGQERAYLISVRELRALEETIGVLENNELMESIARGVADLGAGRIQDADDAFAQLDAEFADEE